MTSTTVPDGFVFGVATDAYQIDQRRFAKHSAYFYRDLIAKHTIGRTS